MEIAYSCTARVYFDDRESTIEIEELPFKPSGIVIRLGRTGHRYIQKVNLGVLKQTQNTKAKYYYYTVIKEEGATEQIKEEFSNLIREKLDREQQFLNKVRENLKL